MDEEEQASKLYSFLLKCRLENMDEEELASKLP